MEYFELFGIITHRQRAWGKVMLSVVSVCNYVQGGEGGPLVVITHDALATITHDALDLTVQVHPIPPGHETMRPT